MRINISMNDDLCKEVDAYCKQYFISRSAFISMAVRSKLQSEQLIEQLPTLSEQLKDFQKTLNDKLPDNDNVQLKLD